MPSPNVNGAVGRLGAMYHHLQILSGFIDSSIEVLGNPPSDPEGGPALNGVIVAAQEISDNIGDYLKIATTPQEFIDALEVVKVIADGIISKFTPITCSDYTTKSECPSPDCFWDPSSPGGICISQ
jgi:hypothetical protein